MPKTHCLFTDVCEKRKHNQVCPRSRSCFFTPEMNENLFRDCLRSNSMEVKEEDGRMLLQFTSGIKLLYFDRMAGQSTLTSLRNSLNRYKAIIDRMPAV